MRNKTLIVFLFILFAIPVPVAVLGSLMALLWFVTSITEESSFVEIIMSLSGFVIGATYIVTYICSLKKTTKSKRISLKTFLPLFHCLTAALFLLLLNPAGDYISNTREYFGFAKKDFTVVEELDTHSGFFGDGYYYLILDCSDNKNEALNKVKGWKKLPLSENLERFMYGGYESAKKARFPQTENGYYIFEDRSSESTDSTDDTDLFNRHSFNFSIAVYDCDTDKMYYFEYDT